MSWNFEQKDAIRKTCILLRIIRSYSVSQSGEVKNKKIVCERERKEQNVVDPEILTTSRFVRFEGEFRRKFSHTKKLRRTSFHHCLHFKLTEGHAGIGWGRGQSSVTRFGDFSVFLRHNFNYQSSLNVWWLSGYFYKTPLFSKNCCRHFWVKFGKLWATFDFSIWSHWGRVTRFEDILSLWQ